MDTSLSSVRVSGVRFSPGETNRDVLTYTDLLQEAGEFGTFQRRLVALTFLPNTLSAYFMFVRVFVLRQVPHYCNTSWLLAIRPNLTISELFTLTLPKKADGSFEQCLMYSPVQWDFDSIVKYGLNETQPCQNGWIYINKQELTTVNEFNLVCDKASERFISMSSFVIGLLFGSLITGTLCDSYRMVGPLPKSSSNHLGSLLLCLWSCDGFFPGLLHPSLETAIPGWWFPSDLPDLLYLLSCEEVPYGTVLSILQNRKLRKMTMVLVYVWFSISCCYFSLSSYMKKVKMNPYGSHIAFPMAEVPSRFLCVVLVEKLGRKTTLSITLYVVGFACLTSAFISKDLFSIDVTLILMGNIGMAAAITVSFIYSVELYPSTLRPIGLGLVSLGASIGIIMTPLIVGLDESQPKALMTFCGLVTTIGGFLCFQLPET
ncbi:solute carrier family 22 member 6-B isoform X3 [Monodelphis domestica]|uniref:solute carrier family 22 member 6-B isoform X3 n=1 Tax=Monodelphis domestica TaxID=13616 RepID=UPI0024E1E4FE|nr:solute carrier family 22 member 6-B isoform X3 [Monodelphis domestica]